MKSPIRKAVLLVGGKGTRLRPLTLERPKALVPLLNQPLLSYELSLLARHGITDVILAVGYRADALKAALGDGSAWNVRLTYVEDPSPLGTAGALKNVESLIDGPFVAMNGDLVYDVDLGSVTRAHIESGATITFCLRRVEDIRRFGLIQCDDNGRVLAFKEKQEVDETRRNTVNSGLYVMSPDVPAQIPPGREFSNETQLFPGLLEAGHPLFGFVPPHQGYWADVGTLESYLQTSRDLLGSAIPWVRGSIAASADISPEASIHPPVCIGDDVNIAAGSVIGPNVAISRGCRIENGSRIRNAILWEDAQIQAGCELADTVVGARSTTPEGSRHVGEVIVQ